jgi:hypothetical protein
MSISLFFYLAKFYSAGMTANMADWQNLHEMDSDPGRLKVPAVRQAMALKGNRYLQS